DALIEAGDDVVALDDLSAGRRENLSGALDNGAELRVVDITDADAVASNFAELRPDRVFHLAAQADVRDAVADPGFDARVNVLGTIHVLEAARERAVPLVFASTGGAIYGEGAERRLPLDESARCEPETPYGMSKLAGEGYLELYARAHGLPCASLRLGNVYGPRQDPHGEAGVVTIFCGRLEARERPTVFGDGRQTRDYVYVADVVAAFVAAAEGLGGGDPIEAPLNIGTARQTRALALGERGGMALDRGEAAPPLGWTPTTDLGSGLERTLDAVRAGV